MIRRATMADVKQLHSFLLDASKTGEILPRSLHDLYACIRDYWIFKEKKNSPILASSSFHICWDNLGEVRNLYVSPGLRSKGIGETFVKMCLDEAKNLGVKKIFALTYRPTFFQRFGFKVVDKGELPSKVWADCLQCVRFPDCDETAVVFTRGVDRFKRIKT